MADTSSQSAPPLRLTVPATDSVANPNVETRPAKLRKWIDNLPYANPSKVEELLLDSLYHLNRHPKDISERAKLMDCYRIPYDNLFKTVRKAYRKKGMAAQAQPQKKASMLQQITTEMSYGYKWVINEILEKLTPGKKPSGLETAIYLAMKALTQELMLQYAEFSPDSKKTWREIFQLYSLAEEHELQHEQVEVNSSIDLLFKRILLIILVDPYHLHRGEVWSCYDYLGHRGELIRLEKTNIRPKGDIGLFLVDLESIQPPKPLPADIQLQPQHRILHVGPLCQKIHKQLQLVQGNSKATPEATEKLTAIQSIQMFRHMLLAWHVRPERLSPRLEKYGTYKVACGLSAASYFIGKDTIICEQDKNPFGLEDESTSLTLEGYPTIAPSTPKTTYYKVFEWRIFNISATGMGLIIKAPFPQEAQVGQLVVVEVERKETNANCSVGIIRRMIQRDDDTLEIGIQFAQGKVHPISLQPQIFGSDIPVDYQSGLLVEGGKKTPATIFAPYGMFRPRQEYLMDKQWTVIRVFANKLLESTPAFDRFSYEEMQSSMAPEI